VVPLLSLSQKTTIISFKIKTMTEKSQVVYVLTNPAMENLIKIGKTTRNDVQTRMRELYTTGVPVPFECVHASEVKDATATEKALHEAFAHSRINPKREFFKLSPTAPIAILKLIELQNITKAFSDEMTISKEDNVVLEKFKSKRPALNFQELGIPIGAEISFTLNPSILATIVSSKKVNYEGEISFLTPLTTKLLERETAVQPSPYWMYKNRSLKDIYDEYHNELEAE
jgi:hypothetical protein